MADECYSFFFTLLVIYPVKQTRQFLVRICYPNSAEKCYKGSFVFN